MYDIPKLTNEQFVEGLKKNMGCPTDGCSNDGTQTIWMRGSDKDGTQCLLTVCPVCKLVGEFFMEDWQHFIPASGLELERNKRLGFPIAKTVAEIVADAGLN
jgi:hypothetical protein